MRATDLLRATILRWTLGFSGAFLLVALALTQLWVHIGLRLADAEERELVREVSEFAASLYRESGIAELQRELPFVDSPIWDDELITARLHEEDILLLIETVDGDAIFGVRGLGYESGWYWQALRHEDWMIDVRSRGTVLDERHRLVVAKPRGLGQLIARESMAGNARRLVFIVTPLGLLMGLALSWRTVRRLDGLGAAFDRVGSGALQERIPISSRNDEFDRLADRFNQMLVRLAALQDNLEDVSVGVAHDLRTPIARLGQRLQRIRQDFDEPERIAAHLDVADEEVASIIRTFEALLRMGEINSGQRRERFRSVDLSHVVEELARSYAAVFETEERSLAISVVPGVLILGDEDLIAQLLGNLLDNSIEHGDPGGETWVRLQTSALGALLQIGDDGPGIGANLHERVFERFVRGDAARSSPGNGLGLSLVKAIAELHDASIVLQRGVPGTVIDVEFPRASGRGRRTSAT